MNNFFNFNFSLKIFIYLIILLLFEGLLHFYYYKISQILEFIPFKNKTGFNSFIWSENGLVEFLQVIFLLISIIFLIKFFKKIYKEISIFENILIALYLSGILYYFFEEISWGQHLFGWQTPGFFFSIKSPK